MEWQTMSWARTFPTVVSTSIMVLNFMSLCFFITFAFFFDHGGEERISRRSSPCCCAYVNEDGDWGACQRGRNTFQPILLFFLFTAPSCPPHPLKTDGFHLLCANSKWQDFVAKVVAELKAGHLIYPISFKQRQAIGPDSKTWTPLDKSVLLYLRAEKNNRTMEDARQLYKRTGKTVSGSTINKWYLKNKKIKGGLRAKHMAPSPCWRKHRRFHSQWCLQMLLSLWIRKLNCN